MVRFKLNMKQYSLITIKTIITAAIIAAVMIPSSLQAQFLKALLNRAAEATKQAHTVKDSSVLIKPKMDSLSAALKKMSADTIGMTGYTTRKRIVISSADSAAVISKFKTGTGSNGLFFQYLMTSSFKIRGKDSSSSDTMKIYIADNYNGRTEFGLTGSNTQTITHADLPGYSILLTPQSKTYVLNIRDTAATFDNLTYKVVKVGNENIQGYNCIHAKLIISTGKNKDISEDVWTSKDVPGYANLKQKIAVQNITQKMLQALTQAGCDGFFVKMEMQNLNYSMMMILTVAKKEYLPATLFQIPYGYTQEKYSNPIPQFNHN